MSVAALQTTRNFGAAATSMPRTMLRADDAPRIPRAFRIDDHDKPRSSNEDPRAESEMTYTTKSITPAPGSPSREDETSTPQAMQPDSNPLTLEETVDLFKRMIHDARQDTQHALAGHEEVSEAVRPKLTLDLGHSRIARLPESVVDLIKTEVERLSLSHNQIWHIPLHFGECSQLRYLNIRTNVFREIPRGVYKLPLLEILDISRNKIRKISHEIRQLNSLRVFSLTHNRIEDLPPGLAEMTKLQILKIAENPLRPRLKKVVEVKEAELATLEMTDTEKETVVTAEIKRHLKESQPVVTPVDVESSAETSESLLDTPKPLKRVLSSRFPVIPSTSISESASELTPKSPGQQRPPPVPTRSHYRIASGQSAALLRRPGIAPLINGNERNRSNSESVLQASAAARSKRMGMMRKEKTDLSTVEDIRPNRHSHLRGFSHGSALRSRGNNLSSAASPSASSPNSPKESRKQRSAYVRRLSSLPEHKQEYDSRSPDLEGAKGVLYALYQIHPQISGLINVIKDKDFRRTSLELTFYNASSHVDRLNEALEQAEALDEEDEDALDRAEGTVQRDCETCIMAYTHVTTQLQDNVRKIVAGADARYVRTLMLLLYGSIIEVKNAVVRFGVDIQTSTAKSTTTPYQGYRYIHEDLTPPQLSFQSNTPARDPPIGPLRPGPHFRSDTAIQHPTLETIPDHPLDRSFVQQANAQYPAPIHLTGSTLDGYSYSSSISSPAFGSTVGSPSGPRSRSNSRSTTYPSFANSSVASSLVSTPRSGESFPLVPPTVVPPRLNPATGLTHLQEEAIFEGIFLALTRAYDSALQAVPIAHRQFVRCLEAAEEARQHKDVRDLWSNLIWRCKTCLDVSEALHMRLVSMRLKDSLSSFNGIMDGRNDRSFWQLCKTFMQSFVDLVTEMKEAKSLRLIAQDIVVVLRPVQKASREAGRLIEASPWGYMTDTGAIGPNFPNVYANGAGMYPNGINGMNAFQLTTASQQPYQPSISTSAAPTTKGLSSLAGTPVNASVPATPLSAALGPAAQATVPSTPASSTPVSAYGDQFFAGNVFQRADSLLNMPQASGLKFATRR